MVRLFKEDSYDDMLNPKLFMIHDVWEDEVYDVVEKAKSLGIKEEDIDYDGDNQIIKVSYSPYSGMAFDRCAKLYNWFIHFKDWGREAEFNESVSLKEREYVDDKYVLNSKESMNMEDDLRGIYVDDSLDILEDELSAEGFEYYDEGQCIEPKDCGYRIWVDGTFKVTIYYGLDNNIVFNIYVKEKDHMMEGVEIEVKHEGILEVPEGKTVDQLPMSHFEKLAKKNGLGKITKALNNLQVWNKNDDPKLSKWAGNMIDKLNKKLKKDESLLRENDDYWWSLIPSGLIDVVKEMERLGWEGVGYTTTGVDYCISATDNNRPELDYEMCVSIHEYDDAVSLSKYVDIYDWDKEKEVSRVPNSSGVSKMRTVNDVKKFTNWFNALANGSNRGSNVRLNRESLGYDRYDPNVEADFIEPGNLYDDMPETEYDTDDTFEFYVSYCMNNCGNEEIAKEYLESENLPESFIDSIIDEVYARFEEDLTKNEY